MNATPSPTATTTTPCFQWDRLPATVPAAVVRTIALRFPDCTEIMLGGSHAKGSANAASDIDLLVFVPRVDAVWRELVELPEGLVDLAVHDFASVRTVLRREQALSMCSLADDIAHGIFLGEDSSEGKALLEFSRQLIAAGPAPFDFDSLRAHLLGQRADLERAALHEQSAIALGIAFKLMVFVVRMKGGWIGNGRYLAADLERLAPGFLGDLTRAMATLHAGGSSGALAGLVDAAILEQSGHLRRAWRKRVPL